MACTVLQAPPEYRFVTGDQAVATFDPSALPETPPTGPLQPESELTIALSPGQLLRLKWDMHEPGAVSYEHADPSQVEKIQPTDHRDRARSSSSPNRRTTTP